MHQASEKKRKGKKKDIARFDFTSLHSILYVSLHLAPRSQGLHKASTSGQQTHSQTPRRLRERHSVWQCLPDRIEEKPGLLAGHYIISVLVLLT